MTRALASCPRRCSPLSAAAISVLVSLTLSGCFGSGLENRTPSAPPEPTTTTVRFTYRAATEIDDDVAEKFPGCTQAVGRTQLHPSWHGFARFDSLQAAGRSAVAPENWTIEVDICRIKLLRRGVRVRALEGAAARMPDYTILRSPLHPGAGKPVEIPPRCSRGARSTLPGSRKRTSRRLIGSPRFG